VPFPRRRPGWLWPALLALVVVGAGALYLTGQRTALQQSLLGTSAQST
jgi:hypothetical protein